MDIPWAAVIPAIILYYAWVVFIVVDIVRHEVRHLPRWGWLLIVLLSVPIGGIVYLFVGRDRGGATAPAIEDANTEVASDLQLPTGIIGDLGREPAVTTTDLGKRYGDTIALDGINLEVPAGSIFGLVGPNGAGKTTLLAVLAGLRRASAGRIDIRAQAGTVAVLPDTPQFDPWLTGREVVELARYLAGVEPDQDRVGATLAGVGLTDAENRRVSGYSRGMLQRLGLAATLIGDPRLVLLDEPASALDPLGRRGVLDLVARLRGMATVLFSSHILGDVQEVSDSVAILHEGRLRYQGSLSDLLVGRALPRYQVRLRPPTDQALIGLRRQEWVTEVAEESPGELSVLVTSLDEAERGLAGVLAAAEATVVSVRPEAPSLENVVLELIT